MDCTAASRDVNWLRIGFSGDILRARNQRERWRQKLFCRQLRRHKKGQSVGVVDGAGEVRQRICVARGDVLCASSSVHVGTRVLATGPQLLVSTLLAFRSVGNVYIWSVNHCDMMQCLPSGTDMIAMHCTKRLVVACTCAPSLSVRKRCLAKCRKFLSSGR